jgi:peroxiredoxin
LLALLHAPEVHEELALDAAQLSELEALFESIDGPWFRARIVKKEEQRPILERLEQQANQQFVAKLSAAQQKRLKQLQLQSQGTRMLLRADVGRHLKMTHEQQRKLAGLARATDAAQATLQQTTAKGKPTAELQTVAASAAEAEQEAHKSALTPDQLALLSNLVGKPFETAKLQRIYPMAPEFEPVAQWINSEPLTLKGLRGKVVLVHFYAFQCHNCQANFAIYRRWHQRLKEKGVVVVGIQTPETPTERDAQAVRAAALDKKLEFPIMIDLESKNWHAWANTMWPTVYVVDRNGYVRHWWQGELNWQGATGDETIEKVVDAALAEPYNDRE